MSWLATCAGESKCDVDTSTRTSVPRPTAPRLIFLQSPWRSLEWKSWGVARGGLLYVFAVVVVVVVVVSVGDDEDDCPSLAPNGNLFLVLHAGAWWDNGILVVDLRTADIMLSTKAAIAGSIGDNRGIKLAKGREGGGICRVSLHLYRCEEVSCGLLYMFYRWEEILIILNQPCGHSEQTLPWQRIFEML
jgi:hypothetical protein